MCAKRLIIVPVLFIILIAASENMICSEEKPQYEVIVAAGAVDRNNSIVTFFVPYELAAGVYKMQDGKNNEVVVQVDDRNKGVFVIDHLPSGETRRYTLTAETTFVINEKVVKQEIDDHTISFLVSDNEVLSYIHRARPVPDEVDSMYTRAGYIHPVRTPAGVILTQEFAEVHPHHYGIWSAWTNVEFQGRTPDFWNVGKGTGRVEFESLDTVWEGTVHGGFESRHLYVDLMSSTPVTALNETWEVHLYNVDDKYHIFDVEITQTTNTNHPVMLPEYEYGGVGFRGHNDWEGEENAFFLTSEGKTRENGHGTRARWCHIGGTSGDHLAGIAILDHPGNFRHPQPMYVHGHRTFFNFAVVQQGDMIIQPGDPYRMQYRFITYDGEPDPREIDRLWYDYAYPPSVSITRINED